MPPKNNNEYRAFLENWLEQNKTNKFAGMPRSVGYISKFVILGILAMIDEMKEVLKENQKK